MDEGMTTGFDKNRNLNDLSPSKQGSSRLDQGKKEMH